MPFYQADDSGMAAESKKGSVVAPENRILYQQTHTAQKFLASPFLEPLSQRYLDFFTRKIEGLTVGEDWVVFPDLYKFCQEAVAEATIRAMIGPKIIELNPNFVQELWEAKQHAPEYFRGFHVGSFLLPSRLGIV
jgi:hypothetical protein